MSEKTEKRRAEFAERVTASLDAGVIPWQRNGLPVYPPRSASSMRSYKGINALYLTERCAEKDYPENRWLTASYANKQGFHVREGEQGVVLEYWGDSKDGKMTIRGYPVFNVSQLQNYRPTPEARGEDANLARADEMLRSVGVEMHDRAKRPDYLEKIGTLVSEKAAGQEQNVYTEELRALRKNIALWFVCQEMGIDSGTSGESQDRNLMKSWARSIRHNPRELFNAVRDATKIADSLLRDMNHDRTPVQDLEPAEIENRARRAQTAQEARQEASEALKAEGVIADALLLPDGPDSNLPNADLGAEEEMIKSSAEKAAEEIVRMRASAAAKETSSRASAGDKKPVAAAKALAKRELGPDTIVTNAQAGKTYEGKIIGMTGSIPDRVAIQRITGNQAVLHRIRDMATESGLAVGAELSITKGREGKLTVKTREAREELSQTQDREIGERSR